MIFINFNDLSFNFFCCIVIYCFCYCSLRTKFLLVIFIKNIFRYFAVLTTYNISFQSFSFNSKGNPEDLLIFKGTDIVRLNGQLGSYSFDSITKEDVRHLWQVLNDENVQENLRESALEQIAVIMRGNVLLFYFILSYG